MISKLSAKIAAGLYKKSVIEKSEIELYTYGLFIFLSHIMFFFISVAFGIIFNIVVESIVFFISFFMIRNYAGGIHAPTELLCTVLTTVSILLSIILIKFLCQSHFIVVPVLLLLCALVVIVLFAPLDTIEKPLTKSEKITNRKKAIIVTLIIIIGIIIFYALTMDSISYACITSLSFESILLIAGKIRSFTKKHVITKI